MAGIDLISASDRIKGLNYWILGADKIGKSRCYYYQFEANNWSDTKRMVVRK